MWHVACSCIRRYNILCSALLLHHREAAAISLHSCLFNAGSAYPTICCGLGSTQPGLGIAECLLRGIRHFSSKDNARASSVIRQLWVGSAYPRSKSKLQK